MLRIYIFIYYYLFFGTLFFFIYNMKNLFYLFYLYKKNNINNFKKINILIIFQLYFMKIGDYVQSPIPNPHNIYSHFIIRKFFI
jgi:hypothetical protein